MAGPKRILIAATKQNDGKTTVAMGLICALKKRFKEVGFIKPIGQRYLQEEGIKVDEDSVLIEEVCQLRCGLKDMSPVAVERGFTERYILNPQKQKITRQIKGSFARVSRGKQLVVVEGTGHAGVGSVFDHSNASVASLLKSKVLLVSSGGIGRPIDEIMLNAALFEKEKVELAGVIVNKVRLEKYKKIEQLIRKGLNRKGIELLGVMPYNPMLSSPSMEQILEETDFRLLYGRAYLENRVERILVGAMEPHEALNYISDNSLIITPGDREDIILAAMSTHLAHPAGKLKVSGLVLTGGIIPHKTIMSLIKKAGLPVLLAKGDTYTVTSCIHDLTVKIRPQDREKIQTALKIVEDFLDLDRLLRKL